MQHIFYNDFVFWDKAPNHETVKAALLPMVEERLGTTKDQNTWVCDVNTEFFSKHEEPFKYASLVVDNVYPVLDKFFLEMPFLKAPQSSRVVEIWYNHYTPGQTQEVHSHTSRMDISGIYLLKLDEVNKTVFYSYPTTNTKLYCAAKQLVEAEEGDVILFPSHLSHYVLPCEKERISVAFNIRCEF
jgi:hypothetical protein